MKSFKKLSTKRKAYLLYVIPALIIHELSHIFFFLIFIKSFSVSECGYDKSTQHWNVNITTPPKSLFCQFFLSYSPLISMLIFFTFGLHSEVCMIIFLYQVTAVEVSLPSMDDVSAFNETYLEN